MPDMDTLLRQAGLGAAQATILRILGTEGPLTSDQLIERAVAEGFTQGREGVAKRRHDLKVAGLVAAVGHGKWGVTLAGGEALTRLLNDIERGLPVVTEATPGTVDEGIAPGEGQTRLSYRGVRADGDDRYAKNANGSVVVPGGLADAYRLFRKQQGWQHHADMHEVKGFVGGYAAGQRDLDPAIIERAVVARLGTILGEAHGLAHDPALSPESNIAALVDAITARTEATFDAERAAQADPLGTIIAAAEVLDRRQRDAADREAAASARAEAERARAEAEVKAAQELTQIAAEDAQAARIEAAQYKESAEKFARSRELLGQMLGYTTLPPS